MSAIEQKDATPDSLPEQRQTGLRIEGREVSEVVTPGADGKQESLNTPFREQSGPLQFTENGTNADSVVEQSIDSIAEQTEQLRTSTLPARATAEVVKDHVCSLSDNDLVRLASDLSQETCVTATIKQRTYINLAAYQVCGEVRRDRIMAIAAAHDTKGRVSVGIVRSFGAMPQPEQVATGQRLRSAGEHFSAAVAALNRLCECSDQEFDNPSSEQRLDIDAVEVLTNKALAEDAEIALIDIIGSILENSDLIEEEAKALLRDDREQHYQALTWLQESTSDALTSVLDYRYGSTDNSDLVTLITERGARAEEDYSNETPNWKIEDAYDKFHAEQDEYYKEQRTHGAEAWRHANRTVKRFLSQKRAELLEAEQELVAQEYDAIERKKAEREELDFSVFGEAFSPSGHALDAAIEKVLTRVVAQSGSSEQALTQAA